MPTTTKTANRCRCRSGGGASVLRSARLALLTVTLLSAAAAVRSSDPFDRVNGTRLAAAADDFRRHWPAALARGDQVKMRLRPDGAPSTWSSSEHAVCGLEFTATDVDGHDETRHLPAATTFLCGDGRDEYRVHLPPPADDDAAHTHQYEAIASLGARVATVRLETAGVTAVPLADLCFGFVDGDATRAFCTDVELLSACRRWTGSPDLDFGLADVRLKAKRRYSCRQIVFSDVYALARGFEALAMNTADEAARRDVCQRIRFTDSESRRLKGCLSRPAVPGSPDRQFEVAGQGRLVDVDDESYACERSNATSAPAADNIQTSGGPALNSFNGFSILFVFISILLKPVAV